MSEQSTIARKLVALSVKPLIDELDAEVSKSGTAEERDMMREVHDMMNQLLGVPKHADETPKLQAGTQDDARSGRAGGPRRAAAPAAKGRKSGARKTP